MASILFWFSEGHVKLVIGPLTQMVKCLLAFKFYLYLFHLLNYVGIVLYLTAHCSQFYFNQHLNLKIENIK